MDRLLNPVALRLLYVKSKLMLTGSPLRRAPGSSPLINLLAVADLEDQHRGYLVLDVVDDSIIANADPVHASVG
jgi:hypothetical protein